jgi:hypothetical protein
MHYCPAAVDVDSFTTGQLRVKLAAMFGDALDLKARKAFIKDTVARLMEQMEQEQQQVEEQEAGAASDDDDLEIVDDDDEEEEEDPADEEEEEEEEESAEDDIRLAVFSLLKGGWQSIGCSCHVC